MSKMLLNTKRRDLFIGLFLCSALFLTIQLTTAFGYLPNSKVVFNLFSNAYSVPPPYITFLASILTPRVKDMDRPCLWKIHRNRHIMSRIEKMLEDPLRYRELQDFIVDKFDVCIRKNTTLKPDLVNTTAVLSGLIHPNNMPVHGKTSDDLPCFRQPNELKFGPKILLNKTPPTFEEIDTEYTEQLKLGGLYPGPSYCKRPRHSTAIIIPYRSREIHLRYQLHYTIGLLIQQQIRFQIFVVEQEGRGVFNKGQLMNTGFNWATKNSSVKWDCYIFHDVDMLPEVVGNLYKCQDEKAVIHFAPYIDKYNYTSSPKTGVTVGGAVGFTEWQYKAVNGYSNVYWGWGGEDDDMNVRIRLTGLRRRRPGKEYGRYKMVRHPRDNGNPTNMIRHKLLQSARVRMPIDGLMNVNAVVTQVILHRSHTRILVKVYHKTPQPNPAKKPSPPPPKKITPGKKSSQSPPQKINLTLVSVPPPKTAKILKSEPKV